MLANEIGLADVTELCHKQNLIILDLFNNYYYKIVKIIY